MKRGTLIMTAVFVFAALVTGGCSRQEEPPDAKPSPKAAVAEQKVVQKVVQPAKDAGQAAKSGPRYERLEKLPRPVPTVQAPKVKVKYLGVRKAPVPGAIRDVFVDENDRPKYFVTDKYIYIMRPDGKVGKKIARKSDPKKNSETAMVRFSDDGRWVWQVFVPPEKANHYYYYEFAWTEIYDERGRIWWKLRGNVETLSPNGKFATIRVPEMGGIVLAEMEDNEDYYVENTKVRGMEGCAIDGGFIISDNSGIYFYPTLTVSNRF